MWGFAVVQDLSTLESPVFEVGVEAVVVIEMVAVEIVVLVVVAVVAVVAVVVVVETVERMIGAMWSEPLLGKDQDMSEQRVVEAVRFLLGQD